MITEIKKTGKIIKKFVLGSKNGFSLEGEIREKWIYFNCHKKITRMRRNSSQGRFIESLINNPQGVNEELLSLALEKKQVVPSSKDHQDLLKQWKSEKETNIDLKLNNINRTLIYFSSGKIYLEINRKGAKLNISDGLRPGLGELLKMGSFNKELRKTINWNIVNEFFELCGISLKAIKNENNKVKFEGKDITKFMQFLKTIIGYNIDNKNLF